MKHLGAEADGFHLRKVPAEESGRNLDGENQHGVLQSLKLMGLIGVKDKEVPFPGVIGRPLGSNFHRSFQNQIHLKFPVQMGRSV